MRRLLGSLAFLLLAATAASGCATRNGDLAAFCRQLPHTSSVSTLSPDLLVERDTKAIVAHLQRASHELRSLERVAPRAIRAEVATTADFAQRFATELAAVTADGTLVRQGTFTNRRNGIVPGAPNGSVGYDTWYQDPVFRAFSNVSRSYPGALKATNKLATYSEDHCGSDVVPQGYRSTGDSGTFFGPGVEGAP